jgi:hypothetical protein
MPSGNGSRLLQSLAGQHLAPARRSGRPISDTSSVRSHSPAASVSSTTSNKTVSTVSIVNSKDHTKSRHLILRENGRLVEYRFQTEYVKLEWIRKHRPDLVRPPPSPLAGPVATPYDKPYGPVDEIDIGAWYENDHPVANNTTNNTTNNNTNHITYHITNTTNNITNNTTNITVNRNVAYYYSPQVLVTPSRVANLVQGSGGLFDGPALPALPDPRQRYRAVYRQR